MEWIIENWYLFLVLIGFGVIAVCAIKGFVEMPTQEQVEKVREWLLYAVSLAEKKLGSGTGQLKLRFVYDEFLIKFPWLAKVMSFEHFSKLVDEALEKMKHLMSTNSSVNDFIEGD